MGIIARIRHYHDTIVGYMAKSWIVENILIAKITEIEDGQKVTYDCIYCTILRNAIIFFILGAIVGIAYMSGYLT